VGLLIPSVRWLYDYAWFVGFFVSGGLYYLLMRGPGSNQAANTEEKMKIETMQARF